MENSYGVGVKNRYELFYDEKLDPLEILRQKEEEKEKKKADKGNPKFKTKIIKAGKVLPTSSTVSKKPKDTPPTTIQKPADTSEISNKVKTRPFKDRNAKNVRSFEESKDVEDKKIFRNREEHGPYFKENRERDGENRRGRGGYRGRGRGRGRGGFFGNFDNRAPRREFDRHNESDGSGPRSVEKKDENVSNNWGNMKSDTSLHQKDIESTWMDNEFENGEKLTSSNWADIPKEDNFSSTVKELSQEKSGDNVSSEKVESKENISEEPKEDNAREMTLDEWKSEQKAKRAVPKYNLRKPGEGEDGNQWKKLYLLKKKIKPNGEEEEEEEEEDVDEDEFARRGRQRQLIDIQINFNDSRRGTRGRGRGALGIGPRAERGPFPIKEVPQENTFVASTIGRINRGNVKIKSGQQSAPRVDDWNDFPSLVTA